MDNDSGFTFEISLSVLNALGRQLYRSFATVLGEAISNSWDADAKNVWIYADKARNNLVIKDDGVGMTTEDFQQKFLKVGYSKRKTGSRSARDRPYIGRKGIGKLALLSFSNKVAVISRVRDAEYVGGVIDNRGLDDAIQDDLEAHQYSLGKVNMKVFKRYTRGHNQGTIVYFEGTKEPMRNTLASLRKTIALYFRFSLIDKSFKIFVNGREVTLKDLRELAERTQFLWIINDLKDPFITKHLRFRRKNRETDKNILESPKHIHSDRSLKGFVGTVRNPKDLKVTSTEERVGIDLFVNGRLRERDILKHITTVKVPESYMYGQIHFDDLDDNLKDRFATGREGMVADDEKFRHLLEELRPLVSIIIAQWDPLRRKYRMQGDPDNTTITKKQRRAEELYDVVSEDYLISRRSRKSRKKESVGVWVDGLKDDAATNFSSYADCFVSENLIRKHIEKTKSKLTPVAKSQIAEWKRKERDSKNAGNISIAIRRRPTSVSYLSMEQLANLLDKPDDRIKQASLVRDATEYKPIRDALMHTALLTDEAQVRLSVVSENIKGRVRTLLSED